MQMPKMRLLPLLLVVVGQTVVQAKVHRLFVANRNTPAAIHSIEFNDETEALKLVKSTTALDSYLWTSLSHDRKTVYASSLQGQRVASYRIVNETTVELSGTVQTSSACGGTTAFNVASTLEPYHVYTARYPGPNSCGMALSTNPDGSLRGVVATWTYSSSSGVHGLSLAVRNGSEFLFSADLTDDAVWLHRVDASGKAEQISYQKLPGEHSEPRHLTVHPQLSWAYVVMEGHNALIALQIQDSKITTQGSVMHSLIPEGEDNAKYWSSNVLLSPNRRYLWVTARGRPQQRVTSQISCFLLDSHGAVVKRLFRIPTGVTGQGSNSIAIVPAPWSDEYAIYSDTPGGYVEVFKLDGRNETELGVEYSTAKAVARLQIAQQACCANAIWYD